MTSPRLTPTETRLSRRDEPQHLDANYVSTADKLQGIAYGAVELFVVQCIGGSRREHVDLTLGDAVALPYHVAEHGQGHRANARQKPCGTFLAASPRVCARRKTLAAAVA